MFTYIYGLYCQFLIHSSCASLVITNKINANSPSSYLTYYKRITQQLFCSLSKMCYYTKLENLSSICVFPPHIFMCLLFSTTKFSKCRSRVLGYPVRVYYLHKNSWRFSMVWKFKQETNKTQDGFKSIIFRRMKECGLQVILMVSLLRDSL